ncbi:MAG: phosphotransferase [Bdellovibrionota bacterium]
MSPVTEDFHSKFLNRVLPTPDYKIVQLAGDASSRKYYRVIADGTSWVLMRWEPFDPDNYPFLSVLNHLAKNKVRVPEVVGMDPKEGLVLLEDLGDLTLERKFWEMQNQENVIPYYKQTLDELAKIHHQATDDRSKCTAFTVSFDTEKLLWEMNYGREHLLEGVLKFPFSSKQKDELQKVFINICETLHNEPKRIAHRDYHSRNVMIKFDEVRIIDFQDARMGAIQYDLVSLLRDSYVNMNEDVADKLLNYYMDASQSYTGKKIDRDHFSEIYELQTIQRCFKACGSFASFLNQRGDKRYLKYIHHTLKKVVRSLSRFPQYQSFTEILIDSGSLEKSYENL